MSAYYHSSGCLKAPDTNADGHKDPLDAFLVDLGEWDDSDGDGYIDSNDLDPLDANVSINGGGYGDNSCRCPSDPLYHTSVIRALTDFAYKELGCKTIFENNMPGTEYSLSLANNDSHGGNFTITVSSCNAYNWTKSECEPGTSISNSTVVYLGPGETRIVKVKLFSEFMLKRKTFMHEFNVTPPDVEQPG